MNGFSDEKSIAALCAACRGENVVMVSQNNMRAKYAFDRMLESVRTILPGAEFEAFSTNAEREIRIKGGGKISFLVLTDRCSYLLGTRATIIDDFQFGEE